MAAAAASPQGGGGGTVGSIEKLILECQPFKEGAATLVCVGCFKMLTFPNDARKIKCGACGTETSGVKIRCTSCKEQLQVKLGSTYVRCTKCAYTFQPMATLKISIPEWARGSASKKLEMRLVVLLDKSIGRTNVSHLSVSVVPTQPLRTCAIQWEEDCGADFRSVGFFRPGTTQKLDATKSPMELKLQDGDSIEVRRAEETKFGHDFVASQFAIPTNCSQCKQFIWGIYHQGKKCSRCGIPVHHRCSEGISQMCEADRRQMFGIVNFNDGEDEEEDIEAVIAVVVDDADRAAFSSCVQEVVAPECDPNFMKSLNSLSKFTDDQIQAMWLHYDKDSSGSLEMDEMKLLLSDLVGAGGGKWTDAGSEAAVDRLMRRMDTNGDGTIQWEEFWYFFKAQQDEEFLSAFKGVDLTQEKLYELWYHYDADGSGFLEVDELLSLLGDLQSTATGGVPGKFKGKLESLLKPDTQISWEDFYKTIVPALKAGLKQ